MFNISQHCYAQDVTRIMSKASFSHGIIDVIIHPGTKEEDEVTSVKTVSMEIKRDYVESFMSVIHIAVMVQTVDFVDHIHPHRDNMEVTLLEDGGFHRYKAIYTPEIEKTHDVDTLANQYLQGKQGSGLFQLDLQLVELPIEPITLLKLGGIYRGIDRQHVLKAIIENEVEKLKVDGNVPIEEVIMDEINNNAPSNQTVIPHTVDLLAIPSFMQHQGGGLYKGGLGSFIQTWKKKVSWFVYPTYDTTRFNDAKDQLIIYLLDDNYANNWENTFDLEDDLLEIIGQGVTGDSDAQAGKSVNLPMGVRAIDAKSMRDGPFTVGENSVISEHGSSYKEALHQKRTDGLNMSIDNDKRITSNEAAVDQVLLYGLGRRIDVTWHHSDYKLLRPGMKTKLYKEGPDGPAVYEGTLLHTHTLRGATVPGLENSPLTETTALTLFMSQIDLK